MSEHSVMRRRLAAMDAALEAFREWGTGESAGPVDVLANRATVDAARYGETTEGEPEVWVNAAALYQMLRDLRGEVAVMSEHVERAAMEMGPATWESLGSEDQ